MGRQNATVGHTVDLWGDGMLLWDTQWTYGETECHGTIHSEPMGRRNATVGHMGTYSILVRHTGDL